MDFNPLNFARIFELNSFHCSVTCFPLDIIYMDFQQIQKLFANILTRENGRASFKSFQRIQYRIFRFFSAYKQVNIRILLYINKTCILYY